jgi:hypothetical protein
MESVNVSFPNVLRWSDGDPFEGELVFLTVVPESSQLAGQNGKLLARNPVIARSNPPVLAPMWHTLPVKNGLLPSNSKVWKTSAYSPKGCKYFLYLFDKSGQKVENVITLPTNPVEILHDYIVEIDPITSVAVEGVVSAPEISQKLNNLLNNPNDPNNLMSGLYFLVKNLNAGSLSVTYPIKPAGSLLIMDLTQDPPGDFVPSYGSNFIDAIVDVNMTADARTSQMFRSDGINWIRINYGA